MSETTINKLRNPEEFKVLWSLQALGKFARHLKSHDASYFISEIKGAGLQKMKLMELPGCLLTDIFPRESNAIIFFNVQRLNYAERNPYVFFILLQIFNSEKIKQPTRVMQCKNWVVVWMHQNWMLLCLAMVLSIRCLRLYWLKPSLLCFCQVAGLDCPAEEMVSVLQRFCSRDFSLRRPSEPLQGLGEHPRHPWRTGWLDSGTWGWLVILWSMTVLLSCGAGEEVSGWLDLSSPTRGAPTTSILR